MATYFQMKFSYFTKVFYYITTESQTEKIQSVSVIWKYWEVFNLNFCSSIIDFINVLFGNELFFQHECSSKCFESLKCEGFCHDERMDQEYTCRLYIKVVGKKKIISPIVRGARDTNSLIVLTLVGLEPKRDYTPIKHYTDCIFVCSWAFAVSLPASQLACLSLY